MISSWQSLSQKQWHNLFETGQHKEIVMTDLEVMQRAKMYIDKLANGINPITDQAVPDGECINNVRISRCFFYISVVLNKVIENGGVVGGKPEKEVFSITEEQLSHYQISDTPIPISEIAKKINELVSSPIMKTLRYKAIASYLLETGYLEEIQLANGSKRKRPTEKGLELGIIIEERVGAKGPFHVNLLNEKAQRFIIDNMKDILNYQKLD